MNEHPYIKHLRGMTTEELLEVMDDYGAAHHVIHEAARRLRELEDMRALVFKGRPIRRKRRKK